MGLKLSDTLQALGNHRYSRSRWISLQKDKNPKKLCSAFAWKGTFGNSLCLPKQKPIDKALCVHFSKPLNPDTGTLNLVIPDTNVYVPIVDDIILPGEIVTQINNRKSQKSANVG